MNESNESLLESKEEWRQLLRAKREQRRRQHQSEDIGELTEKPNPIEEAQQLLNSVGALQLLRDIQKEYLDEEGVITHFKGEEAGEYNVVLALLWTGSSSAPQRPKSLEAAEQYIFISAANSKLFVKNGRVKPKMFSNATPISPESIEALQSALLKLLDAPEHEKTPKQQEFTQPKKQPVAHRLPWGLILIGLVVVGFLLIAATLYLLLTVL